MAHGHAGGKRGLTSAQWAALWGYSERQIKNWIALGREKSRPVPLGIADQMPQWFSEIYGKPPPGKLLESVARLTARPAPDVLTLDGGASGGEAPTAQPPLPVPSIDSGTLGIEHTLDRLRRAEAQAFALHEQAVQASDSKANYYLNQALSISAEMRQLERSIPDLQARTGQTMPTADVRAAVQGLAGNLRAAIESMGVRSRDRLLATVTAAEWQAVWMEECAEIFAALCEGPFGEA